MKKFTLLFTMLIAWVGASFAQTAITSVDDIKSDKVYWFEFFYSSDGENDLGTIMSVANEQYKDQLWCTSVFRDGDGNQILPDNTSPSQHFAFIKFEDNFYLYSVGAGKFVTWKNDGAWLTDAPTYYIAVTPNTLGDANYPWNIGFDGSLFIAPYPFNGYEDSGYLYCSGNNPANALYAAQIYEVGELENAEEIAQLLEEAVGTAAKEKAAALDALITTWENVDIFLTDTVQYGSAGGEKLELQVEDAAQPYFIWCNEPEQSEGPIADLIDGRFDNFFHSCWNGTSQPIHYLEVDLGTGNELDAFTFGYVTRPPSNGNTIVNDFPDVITVQGSNDAENYTDIAVINEGLPQIQSTEWVSDNITSDEKYRFLRFNIEAERIYFHMADFWINMPLEETAAEEYLPYTEYIRELIELNNQANELYANNEGVKAADIMELVEDINYLYNMIKSLVSGGEDPLTLEFIEIAEQNFAVSGVGYPTPEAGEEFYTLLAAAKANPTTQARLDLIDALDKYMSIDDIIMPEDGKKYTLTFITWTESRVFLEYSEDLSGIHMVRDTLTEQGLAYPETAVFTCKDNGDGTYSFIASNGMYLDRPAYSGIANETPNTCISEAPITCTIEKIHPNAKAPDATYEQLFSLVALNFGGTYYAPNSSGATFYTGTLPHFQGSWTSAMKIEEYNAEDTGIENVVVKGESNAIYDLMGRKVDNISSKGIYIINGKKVLVK